MESRLIRVRVKTGVRKESLVEIGKESIDISVKERAEGNRANARVIEMLAMHFKVPVQNVSLIAGHHRPRKTLLIK